MEAGVLAEKSLRAPQNGRTTTEILELEWIVQDDLQARDHLFKANTRLVVSIAKRYIGRGVPFLN